MIQRIQTVYLAFGALLSGLLLSGPIVKFFGPAGEDYLLMYNGIFLSENNNPVLAERSIPLAILIIAVTLLYIVSIFLFKNRRLQIRLTVFSTLLNIGSFLLIIYYAFISGKNIEAEVIFSIKMVFPLAGSIAGYLAFRGILKDELLVKSYDRIR
ncbi:MAG: DUF4293 family protein [Bacteroidia bacterium]|nr:MAG: DUF4293 family protein [Bacteroidia bacterium]